MSRPLTLAIAASALIAISSAAFAQGRGHEGGPPPGRGGGGGFSQGGGGGGGMAAPNFSPRGGGGGGVVSGGTTGTYVQGGGGTYTQHYDYRRRHNGGGWWGPAVGFGLGFGYPYWGGYGYGYGWDDDYYDDTPTYGYSSLGGFCATRVRTCQLYEAAPVGAPCSCRIPGGRAVRSYPEIEGGGGPALFRSPFS